MTQVIDFIGGEYRNRTGVHGFAIAVDSFNYQLNWLNYSHIGVCVHFCVRIFRYYIIKKTSLAVKPSVSSWPGCYIGFRCMHFSVGRRRRVLAVPLQLDCRIRG